ncbi:SMP-30/gluconolactonase/LRE family protein [Agriterribacter sp.]|uniref:SMP-30/gluconolactonase/LRE family protein n=1 Tax=Agriterribacter sp. TaxID=2821509 RepID=UPI002C1DA3E7|nr:SMP-30/gluconolactonase/LRE family protein [Agriterribacter sp.]HRO44797.1 SMP-30/gluconolactonase/LRE family protein [Agriterribacter sp.]HRQ18118.1 SMP-30/gluconolactonase/LRE family protein [Agriterribacter sp.]
MMKAILVVGVFISGVVAVTLKQQAGKNIVPAITTARADTGVSLAKLIKRGAALQKVSDQFSFTEGPAADNKGNIFFTDQPNDKIWKYDTNGNLSVFMDKSGRSNGLYFDNEGNLVACADEKNELWSISPEKKVTVLLNGFKGVRFNGPNDLWIDKKGGIYFTDPYYQRDYWQRKKPDMDAQKLYYLAKGAQEATVVDADFVRPNGIIGTPDGKHLYVADIGADKTYKYQINEDGSLTNRQLFVLQGSDGMTLDSKGNLYITGKGVTIYDPLGTKIGNIPVPSGWVGNVCFGGKDRKTLFITASESVYTLQMQVRGVK